MSPGPLPTQIEPALCRPVVTEQFRGLHLRSAFQPIVSLSHRRIVGHEALLRAATTAGEAITPPVVFGMADDIRETVMLDRLCRSLHVRNFVTAAAPKTWLFLNVSPKVVVEGRQYGAFFAQMLADRRLPSHRVVVEVLEDMVRDESDLVVAVEYYRSIGCLVAIDDFGAGHSNFHRIWNLKPDIVKLDLRVIRDAAVNPRAMQMMKNMVSMLHEAGCLVLVEGIENVHQALAAMDADADFAQGYYFGRPDAVSAPSDMSSVLEPLCRAFHQETRTRVSGTNARYIRYREPFVYAVACLRAGEPLEDACVHLISQPEFRRAYLLDADGFQIGVNVEHPGTCDPRFGPLADANGANWFRRSYFRKAIDRPDDLQQTRPYLSVTDAQMCVTLSMAFERHGQRLVLCCDLNLNP